MTPDTSPGISTSSLENADEITQSDLNKFYDVIALAIRRKEGNEMPSVEVPHRIVEHYNKGKSMEGFKSAGYFVYNNVKVYETGRKAEFEALDKMTMEQKNFGGK